MLRQRRRRWGSTGRQKERRKRVERKIALSLSLQASVLMQRQSYSLVGLILSYPIRSIRIEQSYHSKTVPNNHQDGDLLSRVRRSRGSQITTQECLRGERERERERGIQTTFLPLKVSLTRANHSINCLPKAIKIELIEEVLYEDVR